MSEILEEVRRGFDASGHEHRAAAYRLIVDVVAAAISVAEGTGGMVEALERLRDVQPPTYGPTVEAAFDAEFGRYKATLSAGASWDEWPQYLVNPLYGVTDGYVAGNGIEFSVGVDNLFAGSVQAAWPMGTEPVPMDSDGLRRMWDNPATMFLVESLACEFSRIWQSAESGTRRVPTDNASRAGQEIGKEFARRLAGWLAEVRRGRQGTG